MKIITKLAAVALLTATVSPALAKSDNAAKGFADKVAMVSQKIEQNHFNAPAMSSRPGNGNANGGANSGTGMGNGNGVGNGKGQGSGHGLGNGGDNGHGMGNPHSPR